jgi:hypothetical protein
MAVAVKKFINDARVVRPSTDRAPPWRSREGDPSPFLGGVACLRFIVEKSSESLRFGGTITFFFGITGLFVSQ